MTKDTKQEQSWSTDNFEQGLAEASFTVIWWLVLTLEEADAPFLPSLISYTTKILCSESFTHEVVWQAAVLFWHMPLCTTENISVSLE